MTDPRHPKRDGDALDRVRNFVERTTPVIRSVNAALQPEVIREARDLALKHVDSVVQRIDDAVGKATAIEGTVVERIVPEPTVAVALPAARGTNWRRIGVIAAGAILGALLLRKR